MRDLSSPNDVIPVQSRRVFLQRSLLVAGSAAATGLLPGRAPAADPVTRIGKPYMKLSLAAYSYRQLLSGKDGSMTLDDFVRLCADLDLDGCELTSYYFPKDFKDDYLIHLKELTFRLGLNISGTAIANDFCLPPGPERDATLAHTRKWIDNAALMGAPVIRIFAGKVPAGGTEDAAIELCVTGINQSLEYAAQKGVFLALENHGGITETPEQMLKIIKGVKPSPWFGVNFDGGNFRGADPYAQLAQIAPYAVNAQLKVDLYREKQHEEADLARVVKILADASYRGYIVLEYEGAEDAKVAVPRHIATLKTILRG